MNLLVFFAGLALLLWSSDRFIFGASALSKNLGLPPFLIGLTIIAVGSSAPEMFIAAVAAFNNQNDTAIGNVLGSNTANILLILGCTTLVKSMAIRSKTIFKELPLLLGASLLGAWCIHDGILSRLDGLILLIGFIGLMIYLIHDAIMHQREAAHDDQLAENYPKEVPLHVATSKASFWVVLGLVLLPTSAQMMVEGASGIARLFGFSELMIGLTIIALGTSLPELAASITSVLKGEDDLAVGNIVGSNLFNILAVLAIPGIINPTSGNNFIDPLAITRDLYIMLGSTVLLIILICVGAKPHRLSRWQGGILLLAYIAYQLTIIWPFI
tara:strand:- start:9980 stop:10963 length:984 start_codon:yes stop_codon:yes gene_type:complete